MSDDRLTAEPVTADTREAPGTETSTVTPNRDVNRDVNADTDRFDRPVRAPAPIRANDARARATSGDLLANRPARGYSWPAFRPGDRAALTHGTRSPQLVDEAADLLISEIMADPELCPLLDRARYGPAVRTWARAEARAAMYGSWLAGLDLAEQIEPPRGGSVSPVEVARRLDETAARLADRLGLSPLSWARLRRDHVRGSLDLAAIWARYADDPTDRDPTDAPDYHGA